MARIITVTGHRPKSYNIVKPYSLTVLFLLEDIAKGQLRKLEAIEPIESIRTGLAMGWDMAVAGAARKLGLPYTCYVPYEGQEALWSETMQQHYWALRQDAADVHVLSEPPTTRHEAVKALMTRNSRMLTDPKPDLILTLWNTLPKGGTYDLLTKASAEQIPIVNCWGLFEEACKDPASFKP